MRGWHLLLKYAHKVATSKQAATRLPTNEARMVPRNARSHAVVSHNSVMPKAEQDMASFKDSENEVCRPQNKTSSPTLVVTLGTAVVICVQSSLPTRNGSEARAFFFAFTNCSSKRFQKVVSDIILTDQNQLQHFESIADDAIVMSLSGRTWRHRIKRCPPLA